MGLVSHEIKRISSKLLVPPSATDELIVMAKPTLVKSG